MEISCPQPTPLPSFTTLMTTQLDLTRILIVRRVHVLFIKIDVVRSVSFNFVLTTQAYRLEEYYTLSTTEEIGCDDME